MLPVRISVFIFFRDSKTIGDFLKVYPGKSRYCLTSLADKCRNSHIFHYSWLWWMLWKCSLKNQEIRKPWEITRIFRERGIAHYFWMVRSCIAMHYNLVSLFPCYQWHISCQKKHMLKQNSNLKLSSLAQGSTLVVMLLGVQQCRCHGLSRRNHPTLLPQWLQP